MATDASPSSGAYWGYWKHKVEQLWKELEDVKQRLDKLEKGTIAPTRAPSSAPMKTIKDEPLDGGLVPVRVGENSTIKPPVPIIRKTEHENVVIKTLKSGPLNIVDLNHALKAEGIDETVRDTLFNRVKPLMKKGVVDYDESTQTFTNR